MDPTFIDFVQHHERNWGEIQYPGRPALADLMHFPIVAMWVHKGRFMFSAHQQANELNALVHAALIEDDAKPWKLAKIFVNQQPIEFQIKIVSPAKEADKPLPESDTNAVPYRPRIVKVNPLREPHFVPYIDDHDRLMAAGKVIKTYMPERVKPGRDVQMSKRSEGKRTP